MTSEQMKDFVENFSLDHGVRGNQGYNRVLIQLFGYLGNGKSAFINSCKYVMDGRWILHADQRNSHAAVTLIRRSYRLTDTIYLVDNRGLRTGNYHEAGLIYAQLGNLVPLDNWIVWPNNFTEIMTWVGNCDLDPNYTDFIVPVYIHRLTHLIGEVSELKRILDDAETLTGIKPFVVLTYKSAGRLTEMRNMFIDMGINFIFQVDNYTPEKHDEVRATHEEILRFLYEVLKDVETHMKRPRNPRQERVSRRLFILHYAHYKELQEENERVRRQAAEGAAKKKGPCFLQ